MGSEPTIRAGAITAVLDVLGASGLDPVSVFAEVGLDANAIGADPEITLPLRRFVAALELASERMSAPRFGLQVGLAHTPAALGVLGYVLVHSPDLGTAIANLQRYIAAHQQGAELTIVSTDDEVSVGYRILDPTIQPRVQDAELTIGVGVALFRALAPGAFRPREVHFEHGEPEDTSTHRKLLECPVYFGRETNAVIVDAALMDVATKSPDAALLGILERHAARLVEERTRATSLAEQLRAAIGAHLKDGVPTLGELARPLGMSEATLRRRLDDEGTTFRAELDAARRALAERYLGDRGLTLTEVAFLLGYSDGTAFHRAFKRWTGKTPRAFRGSSS